MALAAALQAAPADAAVLAAYGRLPAHLVDVIEDIKGYEED